MGKMGLAAETAMKLSMVAAKERLPNWSGSTRKKLSGLSHFSSVLQAWANLCLCSLY